MDPAGRPHAGCRAHQSQSRRGVGIEARFSQYDKDGDGKLTPVEFPLNAFKQVDKNGDGTLTLEEVKAYYGAPRARGKAVIENPSTKRRQYKTTPPSPGPTYISLCLRESDNPPPINQKPPALTQKNNPATPPQAPPPALTPCDAART